MNRSSLGLLLAMMGAARAAVHESMVPTAPATKLRRAAPDAPHVVVFAVKQPNIAYLEAQLLEMSDPDHAHYGRHFTRQYVNELTANPRGRAAVLDHLGTVPGVTLLPDHGGGAYVTAHAAVSVWEGVLATEFHVYHHQHVLRDIATELVRCESYSLPSALHDHVAFVMNTVQFPLATGTGSVRPTRQAFVNPLAAASAVTADATSGGPLRPAAANCLANNTMSPCRLTQVYGVAGRGNALSTVGVFESLNQSFSPSDLAAFQAAFGLPNQKVATVVGGAVHGRGDAYCKSPAGVNACMESMLDLEYIMGVAPLSPATYWYSWNTTQDIFLDWILAVTSAPTVPLVLSLSYGGPEANVAPSQLQLFAAEAVKLGAQGTTLVVASGDDGVASFLARGQPAQCGYVPMFPASCPWVLSVGATQGLELDNNVERAASANTANGLFTTGGGFSAQYPRPAYQAAAASTYFASVGAAPPVAGYNASGRGYPDVAVAGLHYIGVVGGNYYLLSGTSAAAPVVAGIVALANAKRLAAGYGPVGFLNPALYRLSQTLGANDVTAGTNNCVLQSADPNVPTTCCAQGFRATRGWDPLTGFGSLNVTNFVGTLLALAQAGSARPTLAPSAKPSKAPTRSPTRAPTTRVPTAAPVPRPSLPPSPRPTVATLRPSPAPSKQPTGDPTGRPTGRPTDTPSAQPSPGSSSGGIGGGMGAALLHRDLRASWRRLARTAGGAANVVGLVLLAAAAVAIYRRRRLSDAGGLYHTPPPTPAATFTPTPTSTSTSTSSFSNGGSGSLRRSIQGSMSSLTDSGGEIARAVALAVARVVSGTPKDKDKDDGDGGEDEDDDAGYPFLDTEGQGGATAGLGTAPGAGGHVLALSEKAPAHGSGGAPPRSAKRRVSSFVSSR